VDHAILAFIVGRIAACPVVKQARSGICLVSKLSNLSPYEPDLIMKERGA